MKGRFRSAPLFFLPVCLLLLSVCAPEVFTATETAIVEEVFDGDTLRVRRSSGTDTVRLIGIDAPERSHPTKGKEYYGDEASAYLSSLCLGKTVLLEKGEEETDRYHRLLRYVYLPPPDNRLLNLEMVSAGMARAYTRFSFSRRDEFVTAQTNARKNAKGLWKDDGAAEARWLAAGNGRSVYVYPASGGKHIISHKGWFLGEVHRKDLSREIEWVLAARTELSEAEFSQRALKRGYRPLDGSASLPAASTPAPNAAHPLAEKPVSWEEANRHINELVFVEGTIVRAYRTATVLYLNFHNNWKRYLTLVIHEKDIHLFPANPENHFKGKTVRVHGEIVRNKERLEMTLRNPADIVIIP
ncbi:MAG: thermonuclease family protein [Syntrophorhabdaceae bacterium]|nr:thermonuclease family protein [Syntrophorhabdaceae bacterium]